MPYSKKYNFIHVAIPKPGTTSLVHALKTAAPEISLLKEHITAQFRKEYKLNRIKARPPSRAKHLSALQIKYIIGDEAFAECFKFSIVRNPWARLVTRYFFTHVDNEPSIEEKRARGTTRKFHDLDFDTWIKRYAENRKVRQNSQLRKLVDEDGKLLVDYVGRLETFQQSFDHICSQIGLQQTTIPHVNGTRKGHYSEYYSPDTRAIVAQVCSEDIEYFGFKFEQK